MTSLPILPLDTQSFSTIRREGYLYADKTEYIHRMLQSFRYVFLSRPRRFGKSLILSTIEELFLGNRELFEGLWIEKSGYDFKKHPVIALSMTMDSDNTDILKDGLMYAINQRAKTEGFKIDAPTPGAALETLINDLYSLYKERVVVLIDEYDKPIMDNLANQPLAESNRDTLRSFYVRLKDLDKKIRFVFITGVTKFAQTAIASSFNNLKDITLNPDFAGVCGFTLDEFDSLFSERLPDLLQRMKKTGKMAPSITEPDLRLKILDWYDGYSWNGLERVLNPFSILNFFDEAIFQNFWYNIGAPFFLATVIKQNPKAFFQGKLTGYLRTTLERTELGVVAPVPLLFQTGYLTVDRIDMVESDVDPSDESDTPTLEESFTFKTPNREVRKTYRESVVMGLYDLGDKDFADLKTDFSKALANKNVQELEKILGTVFAKFTYYQDEPDVGKKERHYHIAFQAFMEGMYLDVRSEVATAKGRSDLEVVLADDVYVIIEIKYISATPKADADAEEKKTLLLKKANEALEQIRIKDYPRQHQLKAKKIIEMGLSVYGRGEVMVRFSGI